MLSIAHLRASLLLVPAVLALSSATVSAQGSAPPPSGTGWDPNAQTQPTSDPNAQPAGDPNAQPVMYAQPAPGPEPVVIDTPRFRFGVAGVLGGTTVPDADFSGWLVGMDFRFGLQLNDLIGIYAQPHFSGGSGTERGISGGYGVVVGTVNVDFTLFDFVSFGAGVGYGVINNPSGPALHFRAAVYPVSGRSVVDNRRRGLMIGFDLRTIFTELGTGIQYTGGIGYEAF